MTTRTVPARLAFHALFVGRWVYRWTGADPFAMAGALQREWSPADQERILPEGCWPIPQFDRRVLALKPHGRATGPDRGGADPEAPGRRAVHRADRWAGARRLARTAVRVRRRVSVATWAFDNANHFDLVALPKLAGVALRSFGLDPRPGARRRIEATPGMLE